MKIKVAYDTGNNYEFVFITRWDGKIGMTVF